MITYVLILGGIGVGGYFVARYAFKKDTEIENRRRGAARLAGVLKSKGLKKIPEFLISYSVGDYSGMGSDIKQLAGLFLDGEDAVIAEFENVFENLLDSKLQAPTGRAYIAAKLSDAADYTKDPLIVAQAPQPVAVK